MSPLGAEGDTLGAAAPVTVSRVDGCECFIFFCLLFLFISVLSGRGEAMCGGLW